MDRSAISMCLLMLCMTLASSYRKRRRIDEIQLQYKCRVPEIVNRTECELLMSNPLLELSRKTLAHATKRHLTNAKKQSRRSQRFDCPTDGLQHFDATSTAGQRSLSPYADTISYDKRRIPSYIIEKRCLCRGCINPKTEQETKKLESVPLSASVEVFRKKRGSKVYVKEIEQISVGCTCVVPLQKH